MKQRLIYCLKIWITAAVVSPIITYGLHLYNLKQNSPYLGIDNSQAYHLLFSRFIKSLWAGALLELIFVLIILLTLSLLKPKPISMVRAKMYAAVAASVLPIVLFGFAYFELGNSFAERIAAHAIVTSGVIDLTVLITSIFFYKLDWPDLSTIESTSRQGQYRHCD